MVVEDPPISELRAQGQRAVDVLVDRHYARICHYLLRLVGDAALAEDLAQETFLRAYLALPRLADGSNVSAWLFAIATNLAREHHRRQQVRGWPRRADHARAAGVERLCDGERQRGHAGGAAGFEDEVAQQDLVRRALEQLPLDQRVCLLLYAWTGYTCVEIGEILGRSTAAVRMLLVRARRRFRAAYGNGLDCA